MSVYVDMIQSYPPECISNPAIRCYKLWCHLWADTEVELDAMAAKIGLKPEWLQRQKGFTHYDLTPNKRDLAIKHGAQQMSLREWLIQNALKSR